MQSFLIEVTDLRVAYDGLEVLRGVNLTVEPGQFVSIVGKSGCGKSTFLLALAGFKQYAGEIRVPSSIGMVFQNYAVFPWLTVRDNIAFGLRGNSDADRDATVQKYLDLVDLRSHAHKYPMQLSGGQVQRVALARALAPNPKLVFMDEPFGALDTFTRNNMQEWLLRTWEQDSKTVLFVTHSIEEAMFLADRVLLFRSGQICGDIKLPFERPRSQELKFLPEFVAIRKLILDELAPESRT